MTGYLIQRCIKGKAFTWHNSTGIPRTWLFVMTRRRLARLRWYGSEMS